MAMTPAKAKSRFIARAALTVIAASVIAVLAVAGAERLRARYDLTATRQHAISPRTQKILGQLDAPHEIAVVADLAAVSPLARTAVDDVLAEFTRTAPEIRVTTIDAGRAGQEDEFAALLTRLTDLYAEDIDERAAALDRALAARERATHLLQDAAAATAQLAQDADPVARASIENLAAALRIRARESTAAAEQIETTRGQSLLGSPLAPLDDALRAARATLESIRTDADAVRQRLAAASLTGDAAERALQALAAARDVAAAELDALERLGTSELYAVVRALEQGDAVVVVSETGATAVAFASLFPAPESQPEGRSASEFRFIGEELLATALASLSLEERPIVVLTHPWPIRLTDDAGAPNPNAGPLAVAGLLDRLRLRGIDAAEWPVATQDAPPDLSGLNPAGDRPVVWAVLGTVAGNQQTAIANGKLGAAIEDLLRAGEPLLLSYSPSTLPGAGATDLLTAPLEPLGVTLDTGRPLIQLRQTPQGDQPDPGFTLTSAASDHPVAEAVGGLATRLGWISPIDLDPAPGVSAAPLLSVEDARNTWAESQWIDLWSSSNVSRRRPPELNPSLDDPGGPWTVAAAVERANPDDPADTQRLVVVGATAWFFDASILPARRVDGRVAAAFPGNGELFDASVAWLAGQDQLIAPGAVARDIPRIKPIPDDQLALVRWALALGPAAAVLLLGAAIRIIRG